MNIKALVIAGNYKEFIQWCQKIGFDPEDYRYIRTHFDCYGYHDLNILLVGQFWKGTDYKKVAKVVQGGFEG